jgi:hypothetical protein
MYTFGRRIDDATAVAHLDGYTTGTIMPCPVRSRRVTVTVLGAIQTVARKTRDVAR